MSTEIVWLDELPEGETGHRLKSFVQKLKANPGKWGQYPYEYANKGVSSALTNARNSYPDIEWERRGNTLYGRYTPK